MSDRFVEHCPRDGCHAQLVDGRCPKCWYPSLRPVPEPEAKAPPVPKTGGRKMVGVRARARKLEEILESMEWVRGAAAHWRDATATALLEEAIHNADMARQHFDAVILECEGEAFDG